MLASSLIIVISLVLLVYWFRYSCVLLLRDAAVRSSEAPLQAARFGFAAVRERLGSTADLDPLHDSLRRDYELIMYLVKHASGMELASIEDRLLILDYEFMQLRYRLTRALLPGQARQALSEMVSVLDILARRMGPQNSAYDAG
jgi:hypothetical protein